MSVTPRATKVRYAILLSLCVAATVPGTGCSGINTSKSFSPLDFLLPGMLHIQNGPEKRTVPEATNSIVSLAQAK